MKIIAVVNQKGGAGKTTLASLIVKTIADANKAVLAVDCDPQGGLTSVLLGQSEAERAGLYEFIIGEDAEKCIHHTEQKLFGGVIDVIPADYRVDKVFLSIDPYALEPLTKLEYDFMVLDTPPTVQGITRAAMIIADLNLIPTEISIQSKSPTKYTLDAISKLKKRGAVIFSGWKEPISEKGFQDNLMREFKSMFINHLVGNIPRLSGTVSFASEWKKAGAAQRETILQVLRDAVGVN